MRRTASCPVLWRIWWYNCWSVSRWGSTWTQKSAWLCETDRICRDQVVADALEDVLLLLLLMLLLLVAFEDRRGGASSLLCVLKVAVAEAFTSLGLSAWRSSMVRPQPRS